MIKQEALRKLQSESKHKEEAIKAASRNLNNPEQDPQLVELNRALEEMKLHEYD